MILGIINSIIFTFYIWGIFYYKMRHEDNYLRNHKKLLYNILSILEIVHLIIFFVIYGFDATTEMLFFAMNLFVVDRLYLLLLNEKKVNNEKNN